MPTVYLDNAATTPVRVEVREAMQPYLSSERGFGNPSSIHAYGQEAKAAMDESRDILADALGAEPSEITFTGGGTEADNLALTGIMLANQSRGNHLITSKIEHEAILNTARFLERLGFQVTYLDVDSYGMVPPEAVEQAITDKTTLISIMHANNEVGTIEPIADIARIARQRGIALHTDAVQTFGQIPVTPEALGVDALSISAHKINGPKGAGALYVRRGTAIDAIVHGGGQERGRRSGTENVAGIVGFAEAVRLMLRERDAVAERCTRLRDAFVAELQTRMPDVSLNGHPTLRLPNNINISVPGVEGEAMLLNLDLAGIAASSGSACASGSIEPSHVLTAMRLPPERLRSALRLTLGRSTSDADMAYALETLGLDRSAAAGDGGAQHYGGLARLNAPAVDAQPLAGDERREVAGEE